MGQLSPALIVLRAQRLSIALVNATSHSCVSKCVGYSPVALQHSVYKIVIVGSAWRTSKH